MFSWLCLFLWFEKIFVSYYTLEVLHCRNNNSPRHVPVGTQVCYATQIKLTLCKFMYLQADAAKWLLCFLYIATKVSLVISGEVYKVKLVLLVSPAEVSNSKRLAAIPTELQSAVIKVYRGWSLSRLVEEVFATSSLFVSPWPFFDDLLLLWSRRIASSNFLKLLKEALSPLEWTRNS